MQWGCCPRQRYCALWDADQEKASPQGVDRYCGDPSMRRLMRPVPQSPPRESAVSDIAGLLISRVAIAAALFFKVRSSYAKVRNPGGGYWRKRRESRVRGRLRCRARFAACWAFAPATVCYLKVTKRGCGCGPSGLRAHSRNLKELGTPELIPAGRELFVGFGSFVGDDDSRRH